MLGTDIASVNIKTEIARLAETLTEKAELLSHFTKHKDQQSDALSDLGHFDADKDKLAYLRTFLKPDPLLINEVLDKIKFIYDQVNANLYIFYKQYPKEDIVPYKWTNHAENHKEQRIKIIKYLNDHLKPILPEDIIIEDVVDKKEFLNMRKDFMLPFNIHGGTDIILVKKDCVQGKLLKHGIHATIELKKVIEEHHIPQAILEMIVADCFVDVDVKVIGVLTDMNNVWNIFWLSKSKKIMEVTLTNRKTALKVISKMVKSAKPRINGIADTNRMKFLDLFDGSLHNPYDDIAPMEDFYEEMNEDEILKHKTRKAIYALRDNPIFSNMLEPLPSGFNSESTGNYDQI
ncbi:hypothetical protein C1645_872266 [Glomus cerebriforme]|uniref:Uncharacterized protein n=1 Tax=Glomus cerebriforme TaxID=658196 RepID=A0A397TMK0_9GLOM|nr:hypothetical protein C1645_872266 [Glomus cerebriforme]